MKWQDQRCPGCHIRVDLRVYDDPFCKLLYVMEKHRVDYRIFYVFALCNEKT